MKTNQKKSFQSKISQKEIFLLLWINFFYFKLFIYFLLEKTLQKIEIRFKELNPLTSHVFSLSQKKNTEVLWDSIRTLLSLSSFLFVFFVKLKFRTC